MAKVHVKILKGSYRNKPVTGVFPVVRPFTNGANGGFITVRAEVSADLFLIETPRIKVEEGDFVLLGEDGAELTGQHEAVSDSKGNIVIETNFEKKFIENETEEDAMARIRHTFDMLDRITDSVARGIIRGLVVSGPPGVGKSFGVEKQLQAANMFRTLRGEDPKYEILSGAASPIGLYQKLYQNREKGQVLCFDDCDGVLFDETCLNLLKAGLNSGERRRICWNSESRVLNQEDIPNAFDFNGNIIFLTNIDFDRVRAGRIADHLKAIVSRCHYLDLEIGSMRDKLLRIKQIVNDGMLKEFEFSEAQEAMIVNWIMDNSEFLREVSLRMVKKVADFVKAEPVAWREYAEATCLTKEAKFKRLLDAKEDEQSPETDVVDIPVVADAQ